jgi:hypothetical protein
MRATLPFRHETYGPHNKREVESLRAHPGRVVVGVCGGGRRDGRARGRMPAGVCRTAATADPASAAAQDPR